MKNQAVVDIEDYYSLRKRNEEYETRAKELEKKEVERREEIKMLKIGLIAIVTNGGINASMEPPYAIHYKEDKLTIKLRQGIELNPNVKDVIVLK